MKPNKQTLRKEIAEILADYKYNDTKIETTEQVADVIISRIHTQAIKEVLEIIDKRIKECKSCQLTDKYEEQIEEDQIMIDTLNYIKSEINSEKTTKW